MFYTKDIYLDAVSEMGIHEIFKIYNDYELQAGINHTSDFVVPMKYEKLKEKISEPGDLCFLVRECKTDKVIGYCSLLVNWITRIAMPMLFIGKEYKGKGYGKQLMALLMHIAFQEINCRKISITVYSFNECAIHVYKTVGFKEEGRNLKECYRKGQYWDVIYFGLFYEDYDEYWRKLVKTNKEDFET